MKYLIVMTTFPDRKSADRTCRVLVEKKLAACCQIVPGVRSIYHWKGRIEENDEFLCLMKTTKSKFSALKRMIEKHHPYEVPEITAVGIAEMNTAYESWMNGILGKPKKK